MMMTGTAAATTAKPECDLHGQTCGISCGIVVLTLWHMLMIQTPGASPPMRHGQYPQAQRCLLGFITSVPATVTACIMHDAQRCLLGFITSKPATHESDGSDNMLYSCKSNWLCRSWGPYACPTAAALQCA
jgi:hypothetical protein